MVLVVDDDMAIRTVLSGRSGETDRIVGLDLGADDYLIKPFPPSEPAARIRMPDTSTWVRAPIEAE